MLLKSKVAIISGAASPRGIGKAMAQVFAEHGARVAILDLDAEAAAMAAQEIGPHNIGLACDVTKKDDSDRFCVQDTTFDTNVHGLVNESDCSNDLDCNYATCKAEYPTAPE